MKWIVKYYDYDIAAITDYDLFPYFEAFLLKLKKKKLTREEFAKEIKSELMYHYWSKCEYEILLKRKMMVAYIFYHIVAAEKKM